MMPKMIIEGVMPDRQYCAHKICAYAESIGLKVVHVKVFEANKNATIVDISVVSPYEEILQAEQFVSDQSFEAIIGSGCVRAEMLLCQFMTRH